MMPAIIEFTVPCLPVAQPRQRHRIVAKNGRAFSQNYTSKFHPVQAFKASVQLAAENAYAGPVVEGPVVLTVLFVMPRPMSMIWKKRPMPRVPHTGKPDVENLSKALMDALTGRIYRDDKQVCDLRARKLIADGVEPTGVFVRVEEMA